MSSAYEQKIWLKNYPKNIPAEINPDQFSSLNELFQISCAKFRDKPAFQFFGERINYHQVDKLARDFAAFLQQELKLKKGDRIALMLANSFQYPIALLGALRAGLIIVNVNPLYTATETIHQLSDAGVSAIVVISSVAATVEKAAPHLPLLRHIIVTGIADLLSFPKRPVINLVAKFYPKRVAPYKLRKAHAFLDALKKGEKLNFIIPEIHQEDIAVLQYTGGTTGVAKGAALTHRNLIANSLQALAWVKDELEEEKEIIITAIPMYHIFAFTANLLLFFILGGMNVLIVDARDTKSLIRTLKKVPFTVMTGVNTLFSVMMDKAEFPQISFLNFKFALAGGMALQKAVAEKWKKLTGKDILEAYGLTETSPAVCIDPLNLKQFDGSVGLPISSTEISIRDEQNQEVALNEVGELWVRGPQVMKLYWNREDETKKVLVDGWLKTGDLARMDDRGFIYIVDRKKDMIIVSGFNVYPNEVEDVIALHPKVAEVGVVGVPDNAHGEVVKAVIVRRDLSLTEQELIAFIKQHLTGYKIPHLIEFRDSLPKSNVGKILRRELR